MWGLLAFGGLTDDPQRVLAAVQRLTIVGVECGLNLGVRTAKLGATAFANSKSGIPFHDPQFALCHEYSLAPNACVNETAPVPDFRHKYRKECSQANKQTPTFFSLVSKDDSYGV